MDAAVAGRRFVTRNLLVIPAVALMLAACQPAAETPPAPEIAATEPEDEGGHDGPLIPRLDCSQAAFIKGDTTRAGLEANHGAESLAEETVPWVESDETALVLFPNEPAMRAEMFWFGETEGGPRHVRVRSPETQWIGPGDLTIGATLEQVEQANGGPFTLVGFQNHNEGETIDWLGGAFATPAGSNCYIDVFFGLPDGLTEGETVAVSADAQTAFRSDSPEMRAARPVIVEFAVTFATEPAGQ